MKWTERRVSLKRGEEKDRRSTKQNKSEPKITGGKRGSEVSNPRQEKRRQKGLEAAYNSGLMVGWTKGMEERRCTLRGEEGLEGRITRSLPVAPARASVSGRATLPLPLLLHRCLPLLSTVCLLFPPPHFITPFSFCFSTILSPVLCSPLCLACPFHRTPMYMSILYRLLPRNPLTSSIPFHLLRTHESHLNAMVLHLHAVQPRL